MQRSRTLRCTAPGRCLPYSPQLFLERPPLVLPTHLLDSMRDTDAKILIPGFYDDVRALTLLERQALANSAGSDEALKQEFAIAAPEGN